jgi:Lrp/AsnC family transcriptional regulator, leucine-responsive regulatory protein
MLAVVLKEFAALAFRRSPLLSDQINLSILRILLDQPRLPNSELARRVGMSAPAVRERVQRLEESGLLRGCRLDLDPVLLGYPIAVVIRIRPMPGQLPAIADLARRTPRVVECHRITGEDCFILKAHLESLDGLDALLDPFLAFGQTTTSIVQSSPIALRPLPLERLYSG